MFEKIKNKLKKTIDDTEQIDDRFYAEVMDEMSQGVKDKAATGKAIAQADGDESKFNSLYVKIRAKALQEQFEIEKAHKEKERLALQKKNSQLEAEKIQLRNYIFDKHNKGYFYDLFKKEIKKSGFTLSFFGKVIKKDGIPCLTKIDYENLDFLIVNKEGEIFHRFNFADYITKMYAKTP